MARSNTDISKKQSPQQDAIHHAEARAEIRLAEQKVAWGIKYLYQHAKQALEEKHTHFDSQGIATLTLESKTLNRDVNSPWGRCKLGDLFPNGLANGVTMHVFEKNYIHHPPALYMIQQKIHSLCQAASRSPYHLSEATHLTTEIEKELREEFEKKMTEINHSNKNKADEMHSLVHTLMKKYARISAERLYDLHKKNIPDTSLTFKTFSKDLLDHSTHYRSDTHDILTFNTGIGAFSYDEAAKVTAHDRTIGSGCANLSMVFEGQYQEEADDINAQVNSSIIKHASPVAINDIGKKISDVDLLIDTCHNLEDVIKTIARLRLHGRQPSDHNKPLSIDWIYQMLTTNALNADKQASAYQYVTRAARLLNKAEMTVDGIPISLNINVMNAGINKLAAIGSGFFGKLTSKLVPKTDASTQRRENRHAYLQLSNAVPHVTFKAELLSADPENQKILKETFQHLQTLLSPVSNTTAAHIGIDSNLFEKFIRAQTKLVIIDENMTQNSKHFMDAIQKLQPLHTQKLALTHQLNELKNNDTPNTKTKTSMMNELQEKINDINQDLLYQRLQTAVTEREKVAEDNYNKKVEASNIIENVTRIAWDAHRKAINDNIETFKKYFATAENQQDILARLKNPATAEQTTQQILSITALIYKTYANELYYGEGKDKYAEIYRDPEKAALFNAYLLSFQRVAGMMGSVGCKSANDRTLVVRVLLAALAARPLDKQALPDPSHMAAFSTMPVNLMLSNMVMTNSALFSCINDTSGGTAKVDTKKFPAFASVENLNLIGDFGEAYAAHKMKFAEPSEHREEKTTFRP
jgi:hypothetical protein